MKARSIDKQGWEGKVTQNKDGQTEVQTSNQTQIAHSASSKEIAEDPDKAKRGADELKNKLAALDRDRDKRDDVAQQKEAENEMEKGMQEYKETSMNDMQEMNDFSKDLVAATSGGMSR